MKNILSKIFLLVILVVGQQTQAQELNDIVQEVSESIALDETQAKILKTEMEKFTVSLQLIFDKYEEAEPDPQAMLTDIKHSREAYQKSLKSQLGKEKFGEYMAFVDKVILEILGEAAGLRLMDVQEPIKMTDEQLSQMKPILANAMKDVMSTLMKYVDARLNIRTKLKIATSLKSTKKTLEKETAQVLTPEQISKWNELKEAAKAAAEGK